MTPKERCRIYALAWLALSVILYRLAWRVDPPAHWRILILSGFFALSAVGLLLRVAWTYYAQLTYMATRAAKHAGRLIRKLLGRYQGPQSALRMVFVVSSSIYFIVDLLDRDTRAEFDRARPSPGDHAVCIAAGLAPLLLGWLRS